MAVDLSKLILHTGYDGFKNNHIKTGIKTITGTTAVGANIQTFNVTLDYTPDYFDVMFNGPTAFGVGSDPRPADAWSPTIAVWVAGNGGIYSDYPCNFRLSSQITSSTTFTIKATFVQTFTQALTLTNTDFSYRVIDYSAY